MAGRNTVEIILSARDQASRAVRSAMGSIQSSAKIALGAVAAGAAAAGAAMVTLSGVISKVGVSYNAMMEQSEIAWGTILGSQEKAKETLKELQRLGAQTPYEFEGLDKSAKLLQMAGFEGKDLFSTLTKVGDAVAAIGGNDEVLQGVSMALFQMSSKGKVSAEEMNQLAERGIPAWQMLADGMGKTVPELMQMSQQGKLFAKDAIPLMVDAMGKKFGGAMDKQSHTFNGMMSTMKDNLKILAAELSKPLFDKLKTGLEFALPLIDKFTNAVQKKGLGGIFKDLIPPPVYAFMVNAFNGIKVGFDLVKTTFIQNKEAIVGVFTGIEKTVSGFISTYTGYIKGLFSGDNNLGQSFVRIFNVIKSIALPILQDAVTFIKDKIAMIKQFWDENGAQIIQAVKNAWSVIAAVFEFIAPVILFILKMLWTNVKGVIDGALKIIMGLIKVFAGIFTGDWSKMWEGIKQLLGGALEAAWNLINLLMFGKILGGIKSFITTSGEFFTGFWTKTVEVFKNLDTYVWDIVSNFTSKIVGVLKGFVDQGVSIFGTLRTFGASIFESMWASIKAVAGNIASGVTGFFQSMFTGAKFQFDNLLSTAKSIFGAVKDAITNPIETAKNLVGKAIDAIKDMFGSIKNIKIPLPHLVFTAGSINPMDWGDASKRPSFGVKWYNKGGVFYGPQVIGVGEKRPEFVGALDDLRKIVREESGNTGNTYNVTVNANNVDIDENRLVRILQREELLYG